MLHRLKLEVNDSFQSKKLKSTTEKNCISANSTINLTIYLVGVLPGNHQSSSRRPFYNYVKKLKGKVHPKHMLVSDVRSDKIGKNAIDHFSISPLVLKIFAFKVEELLIWRQPF